MLKLLTTLVSLNKDRWDIRNHVSPTTVYIYGISNDVYIPLRDMNTITTHVSVPLNKMMVLATLVSVLSIIMKHLHHYESSYLTKRCRPLIMFTLPLGCISIPLISDCITTRKDVDTLDNSSVSHQRQVRHSKSCVTIFGRHIGHLNSCVSTFVRCDDHCNSCVSTSLSLTLELSDWNLILLTYQSRPMIMLARTLIILSRPFTEH